MVERNSCSTSAVISAVHMSNAAAKTLNGLGSTRAMLARPSPKASARAVQVSWLMGCLCKNTQAHCVGILLMALLLSQAPWQEMTGAGCMARCGSLYEQVGGLHWLPGGRSSSGCECRAGPGPAQAMQPARHWSWSCHLPGTGQPAAGP